MVTYFDPTDTGTRLEVALSPNPGVWTIVLPGNPHNFRLVPGSVIWARTFGGGGGDVAPAVDVSVVVWPDYARVSPDQVTRWGRSLFRALRLAIDLIRGSKA